MNKGTLVEIIAKKVGMPKTKANVIIDEMLNTIKMGVKKDKEVRLIGFGTFKKATRKARKGVNPRTGEPIKIARKTFPKFVPSKSWNPTKPVLKAATK